VRANKAPTRCCVVNGTSRNILSTISCRVSSFCPALHYRSTIKAHNANLRARARANYAAMANKSVRAKLTRELRARIADRYKRPEQQLHDNATFDPCTKRESLFLSCRTRLASLAFPSSSARKAPLIHPLSDSSESSS